MAEDRPVAAWKRYYGEWLGTSFQGAYRWGQAVGFALIFVGWGYLYFNPDKQNAVTNWLAGITFVCWLTVLVARLALAPYLIANGVATSHARAIEALEAERDALKAPSEVDRGIARLLAPPMLKGGDETFTAACLAHAVRDKLRGIGTTTMKLPHGLAGLDGEISQSRWVEVMTDLDGRLVVEGIPRVEHTGQTGIYWCFTTPLGKEIALRLETMELEPPQHIWPDVGVVALVPPVVDAS